MPSDDVRWTSRGTSDMIRIYTEAMMEPNAQVLQTVEWDGASQLYRGWNRPKKNDLEKLHMWIDKEGGEMLIKELETAHLLNIVAMLYRKEGKKNFQRHKLVTLEKELVKRLQEVINA